MSPHRRFRLSRERGSRVDDAEILHKHPECISVVGSAHELSADRLRNEVRERGQVIFEEAAVRVRRSRS